MSTHTVIAVSLPEAARMVGLSDRTLRRAMAAGELPARYAGRKPLILLTDLAEWVASLPDRPAS